MTLRGGKMRRKYNLSPGEVVAVGVLGGLGMLTLACAFTNPLWFLSFIACGAVLLAVVIPKLHG